MTQLRHLPQLSVFWLLICLSSLPLQFSAHFLRMTAKFASFTQCRCPFAAQSRVNPAILSIVVRQTTQLTPFIKHLVQLAQIIETFSGFLTLRYPHLLLRHHHHSLVRCSRRLRNVFRRHILRSKIYSRSSVE